MLKLRLIFGPLMILALLLVFYFDNKLDQVSLQGTIWANLFAGRPTLPAGLLMFILFLLLIPLGARELCEIFHAKGIESSNLVVTIAGMVGCTMLYAIPYRLDSQKAIALLATVFVLLFLMTLLDYAFKAKRTQGAVAVAGATMFAVLYMGLLPGFYIAIRRWHSAWVVAAIILIVKSSDIGAYFTGRAIGKHKLIPWLSPGKTWEGLVGGVLFSALIAMLLAHISNVWDLSGVTVTIDPQHQIRQHLPLHFSLVSAFASGALIAIVGQFGDLCASLFKRDAGFKDSGHAIPGFGGFLDVFDSPIVVAPMAYWMLALAAHHAKVAYLANMPQ